MPARLFYKERGSGVGKAVPVTEKSGYGYDAGKLLQAVRGGCTPTIEGEYLADKGKHYPEKDPSLFGETEDVGDCGKRMGFTALAIGDRVGHESEKITYRSGRMADRLNMERIGNEKKEGLLWRYR